jgi:lipoprotein-releasing system permease protein
MPRPPLFLDIALGHLRKRKRQTLVSVLGVALGVGFFIGVNALMRGFQRYFVAQVIDVSPHVVIKDEFRLPSPQPAVAAYPDGAVAVSSVKPENEPRGIRNARAKIAEIEALPGVAVAPTLQGQAILRYGTRDVPISLYGIEPERERRVTNIEQDLTAGRLEDLRSTANALIVGAGVADRLGASVGDTITVVAPTGVTLSMKITGLLRSGISSIDNGQGYALLKTAQVLQDRSNVVNQIRIRLADVTQAEPLARRIEARVRYRTESWEETNRNVLGLFVVQNAIMYSVVGAILLVAAFGIYNIISTVVYEKTRDIAILKSLGFGEGDIQAIFLAEGVIVGILGGIAERPSAA